MIDAKYTPTPWRFNKFITGVGEKIISIDENVTGPSQEVARIVDLDERSEPDAARIVACVNALDGLNPEAVPQVVRALEGIIETHDEYCEQHINVSQISYDLVNIARAALAAIKEN